MKPKLLILTMLFAIKLYGQTKMVSKHERWRYEDYYVSETDTDIREGKYQRTTGGNNPTPMVAGYYHENLKDSTWTYYSGANRVAEGSYKAGKKSGVWTGYTRGFERLKYDFTANALLAYVQAPIDTVFHFSPVAKAAATDSVRRPIYINGLQTMVLFLGREIHYPAVARETNKQGELLVSLLIDENGHTSHVSIKTGLSPQLDEEVLRVFDLLEGEWVPGLLNGKPAAMEIEIPVLFELGKPFDTPHKANQLIIVRGALGVIRIR
jgi:TonB family protein